MCAAHASPARRATAASAQRERPRAALSAPHTHSFAAAVNFPRPKPLSRRLTTMLLSSFCLSLCLHNARHPPHARTQRLRTEGRSVTSSCMSPHASADGSGTEMRCVPPAWSGCNPSSPHPPQPPTSRQSPAVRGHACRGTLAQQTHAPVAQRKTQPPTALPAQLSQVASSSLDCMVGVQSQQPTPTTAAHLATEPCRARPRMPRHACTANTCASRPAKDPTADSIASPALSSSLK